jgi:hypothetical protein
LNTKQFSVERLKCDILANLDYLPDKINFSRLRQQVVTLNAEYGCDCGTYYTLCVEIIVRMTNAGTGEIIIRDFTIYQIHFFRNNGECPPFIFTKDELTDYIDF